MSNLLTLKVLHWSEMVTFHVTVPESATPDEVRKGIKQAAEDSGIDDRLFRMYLAPPGIHLPRGVSDSIRAFLPAEASLRPEPIDWDLRSEFALDDDVHLVVVPRQETMDIRVYYLHTQKFVKLAVSPFTMLGESLPSGEGIELLKAPDNIPCSTSPEAAKARKTIQSLDPSQLLPLRPSSTFIDLFPWGSEYDLLHVIVNTLQDSHNFGDLPDLNNLSYRRTVYFKKNPPKAPSQEGANTQSANTMLYGRPTESHVPASLFDKTLCKFRHDVAHTKPSTSDFRDFYALRATMVKIFKTESDRQKAVNAPCPPAIGHISIHTNDGECTIVIDGVTYRFWIHQIKNEVNNTASEPSVEVIHHYIEHLRECLLKSGKLTNFPAILGCQIGPYFILAAAVFTDIVIVEQVATIQMHVHSTNVEQMAAGARAIAALRLACADLRARYPSLVNNPDLQPEFPFKRSFTDHNGNTCTFKYTSAVENKRVFHARDNSNHRIIVKFSNQYGDEAHTFAANHGFAPKLLGVEDVYGWKMVVMEDVSFDYLPLDETDPRNSIADIQTELCAKLGLLHHEHFVHGDVRDVNVLVRKPNRPGEHSFMLIDWDWSGRVNEAVYPDDLNLRIARPSGPTPGGMITAVHDLGMVDLLLRKSPCR